MAAEPERTPEERAASAAASYGKAFTAWDDEDVDSFLGYHDSFKSKRTTWARAADPLITGWWWMFLTKPDLHLERIPGERDGTPAKDALRLDDRPNKDRLVDALQWSKQGTRSFIHLATNLCVGAPFADVVGETYQAYENFVAQGMSLGGHTTASRAMQEVTLSYKDLDGGPILNMHDMWVKYIELALKGVVTRSPTNHANRILDYAASIYVLHTKPDARTLNTWCKYTGVFPTSVPWSSAQSELGSADAVKVDIPYAYSWYEVNDPDILIDFNAIASGALGEYIDVKALDYPSREKSLKGSAGQAKPPNHENREENMFAKHVQPVISQTLSDIGEREYVLEWRRKRGDRQQQQVTHGEGPQ